MITDITLFESPPVGATLDEQGSHVLASIPQPTEAQRSCVRAVLEGLDAIREASRDVGFPDAMLDISTEHSVFVSIMADVTWRRMIDLFTPDGEVAP